MLGDIKFNGQAMKTANLVTKRVYLKTSISKKDFRTLKQYLVNRSTVNDIEVTLNELDFKHPVFCISYFITSGIGNSYAFSFYFNKRNQHLKYPYLYEYLPSNFSFE